MWHARRTAAVAPDHGNRRFAVTIVLGGLVAFGPLSIDLYLSALPELSASLDASKSLGQLTLSMCMVGLAVGQLLTGPLSDRIGRRRPLLASVTLFTLASLLCAVSPNIESLLLFRFVQGFAGSGGLVIARSIVRDTYGTDGSARMFSRLMLITGLAPILAPVLGGQMLRFTDWRGLFLVLGVIGALLLIACALLVEETVSDSERRSNKKVKTSHFGPLLRNGRFVALAAIAALSGGAFFTYISMSPYALRHDFGTGPQEFSFIFATNSVGLVLMAQVNAYLLSRFRTSTLMQVGIWACWLSTVMMTGLVVSDPPLLVLLVPLFLAIAFKSLITPNNLALAMSVIPRSSGTSAALVGMVSFLMGALLPPFVSLWESSLRAMGLTMSLTMTSTLVICLLAARTKPDVSKDPAVPDLSQSSG